MNIFKEAGNVDKDNVWKSRGQIDRQIDREKDRQIDRQRERERERNSNRKSIRNEAKVLTIEPA